MTHIEVRKFVGDRMKYANREWWYDFQKLSDLFLEDSVGNRSQKLLQQYAKATK